MHKKLLIVILATVMIAVLASDLFAGAQVRWAGNFVGTVAATYVPPAAPCRNVNGGAAPPAVTSLCFQPFGPRGAWAFAYGNIVGVNRVSIAAAGTWGPWTFAGKAGTDTTRCSTYVEVIPIRGNLDLNFYGYFESDLQNDRTAYCNLKVVIGEETIFTGGIHYKGDEISTTVDGEFNVAGITYGDGTAEIMHTFHNIDYGAHDPDSVEIIVDTDVLRVTDIPSMTDYGLIGLVILLILSALFIYYRRRTQRAAV
jgi:hypothetical protein